MNEHTPDIMETRVVTCLKGRKGEMRLTNITIRYAAPTGWWVTEVNTTIRHPVRGFVFAVESSERAVTNSLVFPEYANKPGATFYIYRVKDDPSLVYAGLLRSYRKWFAPEIRRDIAKYEQRLDNGMEKLQSDDRESTMGKDTPDAEDVDYY